jgi:hypothetical protein
MTHYTDFLLLINKARYLKPFESFWESKFIVITLGTISVALEKIFNLFQSDWDLIIILAAVLIIDFITGIIASKKRKDPLNSLGMRQSVIKVIEYGIFLWLMTLMGNGFEKYATESYSWIVEYSAFIMKDIDVLAFLTIIWIEVISIGENMTDKSGSIAKLIDKVNGLLKKYEDKK